MNIPSHIVNSLVPTQLSCDQYKDFHKYSPKIMQPIVSKLCDYRLNSGKETTDPDFCTCLSEDTDLNCGDCCDFANSSLPTPIDKIVNAYCYESDICGKETSGGCTKPVVFEGVEDAVKKAVADVYQHYNQIYTNKDDISSLQDCVQDKDGNCNNVNKNIVYVSLGVSLLALIIAFVMIFVK